MAQFYKQNGLNLVQKKVGAPFESEAGAAPPPPPPTWEAPYGGKTDESTGIVAVLGMVREDILKDIEKATSDEAEAVALYRKTMAALETEMQDLEQEIVSMGRAMATAEADVVDHKTERDSKKGELVV